MTSFSIISRFAEHPCGNVYMPTFVLGFYPESKALPCGEALHPRGLLEHL